MFKRVFWLSIFLAVSAFAGQVVIKSGVLNVQDVTVAGESTWDKLANATTQTTQEIWNSTKSMAKSASFLLPDSVVQSLSGELPIHDATVGSTPGEAGVSGGSASYSIPIALPPGRKGMQPNISLSYSSKGGNGVAGMGWNISGLSSIHRCPQTLEQDGQVRAVDYSLNDRLCLDGQRLVAISGTYGSMNTTYATEIDSFARITQLGGSLTTATAYFKVEYKSGEIAYFGSTNFATNNARVIASGVTAPLNWLIARREDRLCNNIVYTYTNFGNGEVQPAAIFYTGFNAAQGDRKVEFIYEARPATNGANDQSSSYLSGGLTRQTQRLTTIKTWVNTEAVREYRLNYGALSASSGRSLLRSVQECAMLSGAATCRRPLTFAWQEAAPAYHFDSLTIPGVGSTFHGIPSADFDGDGTNELYVSSANGNYLVSLDADKNFRAAFAITDPAMSLILDQAIFNGETVDFDQDGKADLIGIDASGNFKIYFWDNPSNTTSLTNAFSRTWNTGVPSANPAVQNNYLRQNKFLDFDGDGKTDIITYIANPAGADNCKIKLKFWKNGGAAAGSQTSATFSLALDYCLAGAKYTDFFTGAVSWDYETIMKVTDFNGDGLTDYLISEAIWSPDTLNGAKKPYRILYGQRNPNFGVTSALYFTLFPSSDQITTLERRAVLYSLWTDVNGDGLEDLLYARSENGTGRWTLRINNGKTLGNRINLQNSNGIEGCVTHGNTQNACNNLWTPWYAGKIRQFDVDSDGRSELLIPRRFAQRVCGYFRDPNPIGDPQVVDPGTSSSRVVDGGASTNSQGSYEYFVACPENPLTGTNADLAGSLLVSHGVIKGLYQQDFGGADGSAYFMNALRIVETGPNQYAMVEVPTDIVDGPNGGDGADAFSNSDVYGDGLSDSVTNVASIYTEEFPAVIPVFDGNGNPLPASVSPQLLPNNDPLLSNKVYINENLGAGASSNGITPKAHDTMASVTDSIGNT
ncbi:MAG: FG-GAP-like repeat-containing protein, partial [Arenimonas sp.]